MFELHYNSEGIMCIVGKHLPLDHGLLRSSWTGASELVPQTANKENNFTGFSLTIIIIHTVVSLIDEYYCV